VTVQDKTAAKVKGMKSEASEQPKSEVVRALLIAVTLGALCGSAAAVLFLPDLIAACAIGGAMAAGALRVALLMSPSDPVEKQNGDHDGNGR
jgi:hypothetical protein